MGTFAETANFVYHLSFDDHGKQTSVFCIHIYALKLQHIYKYRYMCIYIYIFTIYIYIYINIYLCFHYKRKSEAQAIFLNLFTVCSSCKRKFVVCPFVYEETNGSYPFASGLNGLNGLAHLCLIRMLCY
jgi:hypothetical protein